MPDGQPDTSHDSPPAPERADNDAPQPGALFPRSTSFDVREASASDSSHSARRDPRGSQLLFVSLFCASLTVLLLHSLAPKHSPSSAATGASGDAAAARTGLDKLTEAQWKIQSRMLIGARALGAPFDLRAQLRAADDRRPATLRRMLALAGHLGDRDYAAELARRLRRVPGQTDAERSLNEALSGLYDARPPRPLEAAQLAQLDDQLGWLARVVEADHWRLADAGAGAQRLAEIRRVSLIAALATAAAAFGGLLAAIAGAILLLVFVVNARQGLTSLAGARCSIAPRFAFETFTLYLAGFAAVLAAQGVPALRRAGAASALELLWIALAPCLALWPLARGADAASLRRTAGLVRGRGWLTEAGCGLAGYLAILPVLGATLLLVAYVVQLGGHDMRQAAHPLAPTLVGDKDPVQVALLLALAVVYSPFAEELLFRGFFYAWLRSSAGPAAAVAISALVFAGLHPQGLIGLPILFVIGAGLAVLREWRGSLIAPMVTHACVNGVTAAVLLAI